METQVRELWRMVKPGGTLAITTWGQDFFAPVYTVWRELVRAARPDLYSAFNPWDRISTPEQLRQLLEKGNVTEATIVPQRGSQILQSPQDWWTIVLGSGLRGTVHAMEPTTAAHIRDLTVGWVRDNHVEAVQTNVIFATAIKPLQNDKLIGKQRK